MLSKLWPEAFASRCAFSKLPQPRPVDALSACSVATGTPVAAEILSRLAARDAVVLNTRINAATITVNHFMDSILLFEYRFRFWRRLWFPCALESSLATRNSAVQDIAARCPYLTLAHGKPSRSTLPPVRIIPTRFL